MQRPSLHHRPAAPTPSSGQEPHGVLPLRVVGHLGGSTRRLQACAQGDQRFWGEQALGQHLAVRLEEGLLETKRLCDRCIVSSFLLVRG